VNEATPRVVIGMDPHKRSVTIEAMASDESILSKSRFGTDREGLEGIRRHAEDWPDRVWAIEGCQGIGRPVARTGAGPQVMSTPARCPDSGQSKIPIGGHVLSLPTDS
jgi:hypothetical protein